MTAPSHRFDPRRTQHDTYLLLLQWHPSVLPMVIPTVLVLMLPPPAGLLPPLHQDQATSTIRLAVGQKSALITLSWAHALTAMPYLPRWGYRVTTVFMVPIDPIGSPTMKPMITPTPHPPPCPPHNVLLIPPLALPNTLHSWLAKFSTLRHQCPHWSRSGTVRAGMAIWLREFWSLTMASSGLSGSHCIQHWK
jgi:hypothetical protein